LGDDTAVVGAWLEDENGMDAGSAYVFTRVGGSWIQESKLLANDGQASDFFGYSVSISGETIVVSAHLDDENGPSSGSAYVFGRTGTEWQQQSVLIPTDGSEANFFGWSVAISEDVAVVGAVHDDANGTRSGSAYIFARDTGMWDQIAKVLPSDGAAGDEFGFSVAVNGARVIVGSYKDDDLGSGSGSAYIGDLNCTSCPADFTADGVLDIFDVFAFLDLYNAMDPSADFTGDGSFDIFDVFAFLDEYNAGCPLSPTAPNP